MNGVSVPPNGFFGELKTGVAVNNELEDAELAGLAMTLPTLVEKRMGGISISFGILPLNI
jgi:hypothetical protein